MREPTAKNPLFGLMAEFDDGERLMEAARSARDAGFRRMDAYTPFPIEGLAELVGFRDNRLPWIFLAGGIGGAAIGFFMQAGISLAYPLDVGGRPTVAVPAFMLITFELLVLGAVSAGIFGMLLLNHLPRLHHPVFGAPNFALASSNKFFLVILGNDQKFDPKKTRAFLERLKPVAVGEIARAEEPE